MLTGAMEDFVLMLKGERLALTKLEHWWQMPPEDRRKAVRRVELQFVCSDSSAANRREGHSSTSLEGIV